MMQFTDQMQRLITLKTYPPKRIISLVPSQTELLYDLGLDEEVIAITKFCVHPEKWFRTKERIGGTKNINIEKVKALQPDLIIANKEENVREQIEQLENVAPVFISDVNNYRDALEMMNQLGMLTNRQEKAKEIISEIEMHFKQLETSSLKLRTAYFIWRDPYMCAGGDTFIGDILRKCGFQNIFENEKRYPEIYLEQLAADSCELVLLSSEPFPFKEKHVAEIQTQLSRTKIFLADGEMFSWYGSRMMYAAKYFSNLVKQISHAQQE